MEYKCNKLLSFLREQCKVYCLEDYIETLQEEANYHSKLLHAETKEESKELKNVFFELKNKSEMLERTIIGDEKEESLNVELKEKNKCLEEEIEHLLKTK